MSNVTALLLLPLPPVVTVTVAAATAAVSTCICIPQRDHYSLLSLTFCTFECCLCFSSAAAAVLCCLYGSKVWEHQFEDRILMTGECLYYLVNGVRAVMWSSAI
jgi:hypothetical protein